MKKSKKYSFGKRLKNIRLSLGLSQTKVGKLANMPNCQICHIENGDREPNIENLIKLVNALDVSSDLLLGIKK